MPPFVPFGPDHLAAMGLTAILATGLSALVRQDPASRLARVVRGGLAGSLVGAVVAYLVLEARHRPLTPWDFVPLHLCDFLIFVAAFALLTLRRAAGELLYFWAGAGTLLAVITPDVGAGFPSTGFLVFFGFHGAVIVAAAVVTFGCGVAPRRGAARRAFLATNAYAAAVAVVDVAFDANFLYLRAKPAQPTLLDWLGPWPVYILTCEVLAIVLFALLALPFRHGAALDA